MLAANVERFHRLYQKLLKKQYQSQLKAQAISKQDLARLVADYSKEEESVLSQKDKLSLIKNLAKTDTIGQENTLKSELISSLQTISQFQKGSDSLALLQPGEVYIVCSLIYFCKEHPEEKEHLSNLFKLVLDSLLAKLADEEGDAQQEGSDEFQVKEFSLVRDQVFEQRFVLLQFIAQSILKQGDHTLIIDMFGHVSQVLKDTLARHFATFSEDSRSVLPQSFLLQTGCTMEVLARIFSLPHFKAQFLDKLDAVPQLQGGMTQVQEIMATALQMMGGLKVQSQNFLLNYAVAWKKTGTGNKEIKRTQGAFGELQNILIRFFCLYFEHLAATLSRAVIESQCWQVFQIFMVDKSEEEAFILTERLTIMQNLDDTFALVEAIGNDPTYWAFIFRGLYDTDQAARKMSLQILQANIGRFSTGDLSSLTAFGIDKAKFEQLWSTYFDLYDTLDSYSSHLTKSIWDRCDVFHVFLRENTKNWESPEFAFPPLLDFKKWLNVLNRRALTHVNVNIRKYIQKEILAREFMSPQMNEFIFGDLLVHLNEGQLLKDSNLFTQFSKNNEIIIEFLGRFLQKESQDPGADLSRMLRTIESEITHPQVIICCLKVMSQNLNINGLSWIGKEQLALISSILDKYMKENQFSSKYLCFKFCLQAIVQYLDLALLDSVEIQTALLRIIGQMPLELFSVSENIIFTDKEGLEFAAFFVDKVGATRLQDILSAYLQDIFQVKANIAAMPRFAGTKEETKRTLEGVIKLLLLLDSKLEEKNAYWFSQMMQANLDVFMNQVLTSSYLSPEVVDQKIMCFTKIYSNLVRFSSTQQFRDILVAHVKQSTSLILARLENNLMIPLSLYCEHSSLQAKQGLSSAFLELHSYCSYLKLVVFVHHILKDGGGSQAVEKMVELILAHALKVSQQDTSGPKSLSLFNTVDIGKRGWKGCPNLGVALWQYTTYELLFAVLSAYSKGVTENIKKGVDHLLVPDAIFSSGKILTQSMAAFDPVRYHPTEGSKEFQALDDMLIDADLSHKKVLWCSTYDTWAILGEFVKLFEFDAALKQEMQPILYPIVSQKAKDYVEEEGAGCVSKIPAGVRTKGNNWTKEDGLYNQVIFGLLRRGYLPLILQRLEATTEEDAHSEILAEYFQQVKYSWNIIVSLRGVFELEALQEFMELALYEPLLEAMFVLSLNSPRLAKEITAFHKKLAENVFDSGNQFWLILRQSFNHLAFIFARKPYLMKLGFDEFLALFTTCREIKQLDSAIQIVKFESLLPDAIPKKYSDLSLEQINYQGAYIRVMAFQVLEGILNNVHIAINCASPEVVANDAKIQSALEGLEKTMIQLFKINEVNEAKLQSEMPYSHQFREKLRSWQSNIVLLSLLDPLIYTPEFRANRKAVSGFDIIEEINKFLWKALFGSHIPPVRQYIEVFTIKFCLAFPEETLGTAQFTDKLLNPNVKSQVSSSFIVIAGMCMTLAKGRDDSKTTQYNKKIFDAMIGFTTSNAAHTRCMSQYFIRLMYDDPMFRPFINPSLDLVYDFFNKTKANRQLLDKEGKKIIVLGNLVEANGFDLLLTTKIDTHGEFMHEPFLDQLRTLITEHMTEFRGQNILMCEKEEHWQVEFEQRQKGEGVFSPQVPNLSKMEANDGNSGCLAAEEQAQNFQRKVLPWEEMEKEKTQLRTLIEHRKRNQIIICASLIDKIPNLAGLTRTCEIMNAQGLIISNKDVVKQDEFKTIAVTAERWLPIYEVKENNLGQYLSFQKQNGYTILGLEQTANSVMLEEYGFPDKCILLLGKEKEGIPQEYYGLIDQCIEIPQFGIVRSLNVHVSGAVCLWEYTKQAQQKLKAKIGH